MAFPRAHALQICAVCPATWVLLGHQLAHHVVLVLLPVLQVEVFQYALDSTSGEDLHRVLWLKSRNSEVWLDRRTNYTRSCAVMSMVSPARVAPVVGLWCAGSAGSVTDLEEVTRCSMPFLAICLVVSQTCKVVVFS